jgi:hypothetical protein
MNVLKIAPDVGCPCTIVSQFLQAHLGRIVLITTKDAGIYSSISALSLLIVLKSSPPQLGHMASGLSTTSVLGK